jgi:hypothetical protein
LAVDIKNKAISQPWRASVWCVGPPTSEMSGGIAAIAGTQKKAWRPPTPSYTSEGVMLDEDCRETETRELPKESERSAGRKSQVGRVGYPKRE